MAKLNLLLLSGILMAFAHPLRAENASSPIGEPVLEPPTLHCLGAYWMIKGDDNKNAEIAMSFRKNGAAEWTKSLPMFRVEKGAPEGEMMAAGDKRGRKTLLQIPRDGWLFAGSIVLLEPDTAYELKLSLSDSDGGSAEKILKCHTRAEPREPANATKRYVVPGNGGGTGTAADPFKGLVVAQKDAHPGDLFLIHAGLYEGPFEFEHSGEPNKPIIWRGLGDGETILDGGGKDDAHLTGKVVTVIDVHDVWFEKLTLRNADRGMVANGSARIVVRRCHIHGIHSGITATRNDKDSIHDFFIADNVIEGPFKWITPNDPKWHELWKDFEYRGIEITGAGHDVCYNTIRHFKDAMDTFPSLHCAAIDFHHNECGESLDDGCEMDFSERNTRCFLNRFTNIFQGISVQPVFGGPVYIFRNALYNVFKEPFKLHNTPSGAIIFHNTIVKQGAPTMLATSDSPHHCIFRNNLFIGTTDTYAAEYGPKMIDCDFDYDGFGGGPWKMFLKWNDVRYKTIEEVREKAPVYRHAVLVDPNTFASGLSVPANPDTQFENSIVDLRLKKDSAAIDAGEPLPGFNDGFTGKAPDLGAFEFGSELPHYGPRPEK